LETFPPLQTTLAFVDLCAKWYGQADVENSFCYCLFLL